MKKVLTLFLIALSSPILFAQVELSEISVTNISTIADEDNSYEDWFEIRNLSANAVDITGYGLSDDPLMPFKWLCPNYTLASGEHKLIFASGKNRIPTIDHYESIINANESWNYIIPTTEPDPSWRAPGAILSGWLTGAGGFGFGDGDDGTTITSATSVYLRKSFTLTNISDIERLILYMDYDDGFVAYINGVEIARANIGTVGAITPFNTFATSHEANGYQGLAIDAFEINLSQLSNLLVVGENVLAIQVHNAAANSTDLTSNAYLAAGFASSTISFSPTLSWMNLIATDAWHTNFTLNSTDQLSLTSAGGIALAQVTIPLLPVNNSYDFNSTSWCISPNPTPADTNDVTCFTAYLSKPLISKPAGIYASGFKIALSSIDPNAQIRFTTNGDIPTANSTLYTDSINIAATTIISARCFDPANLVLPSLVEKNTFLINEAYIGLPVISISSDSLNLYDTQTGIYVLGPNDYNPNYPYFGANFWEDWERYSYIEYLATDSLQKFEGAIGLKIHGGWSRAQPQKSFRVKCRDDYGMNKINFPLIPDKPFITKFKDFNLRNGGNDYGGTRMRDAFMQRLTKGTYNDYMGYTPVIVFLNGQYFGEYELRETLNNDYIENNHGFPSDSVTVLTENYQVGIEANDGTLDNFWPMYNSITGADPASPTFYSLADSLIDLQNFTDYIIAETYYGNGDWSNTQANNIKYWNVPGEKWRMMLMDLDFGYGLYGPTPNDNFISHATNNTFIHMDMICAKLLANPQYLNYFINRYADLINTTWQQGNVQNVGNSMINEVAPWIPRHHTRWSGNMTNFLNTMTNMLAWNQSRITGARNVVQSHFTLAGQVTYTLDVQPAGAGRIHISTIEPSEIQYPWSGVYFKGVPVKITAIPNPGYTFNHWGPNSLFSTNNYLADLAITPSVNAAFTAWFTGNAVSDAIEISEVMVNAENSIDSDDWIELHNKLGVELNIGGMTISDSSYFNNYTFPLNTKIPANGYFVVARDTALFHAQYPIITNYTGPLGFSFNNTSETIFLKDHNNNEVLHITYTTAQPWPIGTDGDGRTLEFEGAPQAPNDPNAWFAGCVGGSPGEAYFPCDSTLLISEINYKSAITSDAGDWFEIHSLASQAVDLSNWYITDASMNIVYSIPAGTLLNPNEYLVFAKDLVLFASVHPNVLNVVGPTGIGLGSTESIHIYNSSNRMIFSVNYSNQLPWPLEADGLGKTLELLSTTGNMCDGYNWFAGCPDGSPGEVYNPLCDLGLSNNEMDNIVFYPNPVTDILHFEVNENTVVQIRSLAGAILVEQNVSAGQVEINMGEYSSGFYLVSLKGKTFRIVKN